MRSTQMHQVMFIANYPSSTNVRQAEHTSGAHVDGAELSLFAMAPTRTTNSRFLIDHLDLNAMRRKNIGSVSVNKQKPVHSVMDHTIVIWS